MLTDPSTWSAELVEVISAAAMHPWVLALGLAVLTLLLEDAAIAAGILLAAEGLIGLPLAYVAVAGGIAGGDILLYVLGLAARRIPCVRHRLVDRSRSQHARRLLDQNLAAAVLLARAVPGLRLAVYTGSGLFAVPWIPFFLMVLAAVTVWTAVLFWFGSVIGIALARHLALSSWQAAVVVVALLALVVLLVSRLATATRRIRR